MSDMIEDVKKSFEAIQGQLVTFEKKMDKKDRAISEERKSKAVEKILALGVRLEKQSTVQVQNHASLFKMKVSLNQ